VARDGEKFAIHARYCGSYSHYIFNIKCNLMRFHVLFDIKFNIREFL